MKTITLRLDDELHKELKMYSVQNGITIQDLLVMLIEKQIKEGEQANV